MAPTFGLRRETTSSLAIEWAFAGTRGVKFFIERWMNELDRLTGLRPNPRRNVNSRAGPHRPVSTIPRVGRKGLSGESELRFLETPRSGISLVAVKRKE